MAYWVFKILLRPCCAWSSGCAARAASTCRGTAPRSWLPTTGPSSTASSCLWWCRRRVTFVAKAEYFESWKTAWFFRAVGHDPAQAGRRSGVGAGPGRGPGGAGRPAGCSASTRREPVRPTAGCTRATPAWPVWPIQCGAPVIPVAQLGTAEVQPIGAMWPKLFRQVDVTIGEPLAGGAAATGGTTPSCASSPTR